MPWPHRTIWRARPGCRATRSPMQKKVALAPCCSRSASTCGVTSGSGPSSMVMAIAPAPPAAAGSRVQFGPSRRLLGHSPAAGGPVMAGGHRVDGLGGERGRHQALTRREAIVPPEAEMHAQGSGAVGPDEAPEVALVFIVRELAGTPAVHAAGTLDLTGDD